MKRGKLDYPNGGDINYKGLRALKGGGELKREGEKDNFGRWQMKNEEESLDETMSF